MDILGYFISIFNFFTIWDLLFVENGMLCTAHPIRHNHKHHRSHIHHHQNFRDENRLDEIIRHTIDNEELRRIERRINGSMDEIYSRFVSRCRHLSIIPYLDCLVRAKENSLRPTRVRLCSETMETYISCLLDRHSLHTEIRHRS